jgi:hypothetical protein
MREVTFLVFIPLGGWVPLPEIKYVSIFHANIGVINTSYQTLNSSNLATKQYLVSLVHGRNKRIKLVLTENKELALKDAKQMAVLLEKPILDASERDKKWIRDVKNTEV